VGSELNASFQFETRLQLLQFGGYAQAIASLSLPRGFADA
jgi:hypothetical protein